jgi:L-seryl-tRNA(Ser) seleniumtransferase
MPLSSIPSVDRILRSDAVEPLIAECGRAIVTDAIREVLQELRAELATGNGVDVSDSALIGRVRDRILTGTAPSLRPVFNLTGTVLHTNLGRAPLPEDAVEAMASAARQPTNVEFDLRDGRRGDRDDHVEAQLRQLTGAESATVVNNNAAAVLLVLNTLALRKEVPVSRGELIEIGGSFRIPEIMARAGCKLREVGTTNRVHLSDYADAVGPKTALVMKVHTSNYAIVGFTSSVDEATLARLCRERGIPFAVDLGSGTLADLRRYGLPHEPTPMESLASGADLVTFSGDKLLGGPQAGIIVGRADLIARLKRNPLKRALRVDKMTIAALAAVLAMYRDPERMAARLPVIRLLARTAEDIRACAARLQPRVAEALAGVASVEVVDCESQVGSGALPAQQIPSAGLAIRATSGAGADLLRIATVFRHLPVPAIGRIHENALIFDLRCLDDETTFVAQLPELRIHDDDTSRP